MTCDSWKSTAQGVSRCAIPARGYFRPGSARSQGQVIRIAAAADLQFAMQDLVAQFERQTATRVDVTYGSSGNFFSQLQNGAPFDLFFSADIEYPRKLESAGIAEPGTLYEYARRAHSDLDARGHKRGLITPGTGRRCWTPRAKDCDCQSGTCTIRTRGGRGSAETPAFTMEVKSKLVYGENVSQAAQFVQSGNAQAGIVAIVSRRFAWNEKWKAVGDSCGHASANQASRHRFEKLGKQSWGTRILEFVKVKPAARLAKYGFAFPDRAAAFATG